MSVEVLDGKPEGSITWMSRTPVVDPEAAVSSSGAPSSTATSKIAAVAGTVTDWPGASVCTATDSSVTVVSPAAPDGTTRTS